VALVSRAGSAAPAGGSAAPAGGSRAAAALVVRRGHWVAGESRFVAHPQERREECAAALLAEIARDHFPVLRVQGRDHVHSVSDLLQDAAFTVADFAVAMMAGSHGPGCPGRAEEEAADETCNRGDEPYCTVCGAGIHMLRGLAGWHHVGSSARDDEQDLVVAILDPGHAPVLGWRNPALRQDT